jgi:phosphodiesterase/alkaline phosphatase D-like protein
MAYVPEALRESELQRTTTMHKSCLFSAAALSLAAVLAVGTARAERHWPDYIGCDVVPYDSSGLTHGPMLGRPGATSMRVWVRTKKPMPFRVVYNTDVPLNAKSPGVEGRTSAERDNTGVVDLADLKPDTEYAYGIVLGGKLVDDSGGGTP